MSYILDALRRADAERARGSVPDLHAQPLGFAPRPSRDGPPHLARMAVAVLLVAAVGTLAWIVWQRVAEPSATLAPAAAPPLAVAPAVPSPSMAALAQAAAASGGPAAQAAPLRASGTAPVVSPPPVMLTPPAATPPPTNADPRERPVAPARTASTAVMAVVRTPASGASLPASSEARVWQAADLPAEVRRELPPLRFGGAIHSPNPASRLLIVDGLLLREGDEAAPGVRISQIRLKSVVVEFRDRLIELGL
jgi:general secretion pathway protein B